MTYLEDLESEAAVGATLAATAQEGKVLDDGRVYGFVLNPGQTHYTVDTEKQLDEPKRKRGTVTLFDATSFAAYVLKHHEDERTELYADPTKPGVVAVLNGHGGRVDDDVDPDAGWGDHRAVLTFRETTAWQRWTKRNGVLGNQSDFAEHIEESLPEIIDPPAADMLELAQSFQAHTKVAFESAKDLGSGQRSLVYREELNATAGTKGAITIPKEFTIGIAPYEGSGLYRVTARLRYRLSDGRLSIGYVLDRPEDVLRNAFDDVLTRVQTETERIALLGLAPAAGQ